MREIDVSRITSEVKTLFIDANRVLPSDLENRIADASQRHRRLGRPCCSICAKI